MSEKMNDPSEMKLPEKLTLQDDFPPVSYDEWKAKAEADLKGAPFEKKLVTKTYEDIAHKPVYTRADIEKIETGLPGFAPFTRSTFASGYNGSQWEICQDLPYPLAEDFNDALLHDLQRGQTAVSMPLDMATKLGQDADYARPEHVGEGGVSISGLKSISRALASVDLDKYPLYIDAGYSSLPVLITLAAYMQRSGFSPAKVNGMIAADPLGWLAAYGELPYALEDAFAELKITTEWLRREKSGLRSILVSGLPYHNAGASDTQELAFMIAAATVYIDELVNRGLTPDEVFSSITFQFGTGPHFFMQIAKFRAAKAVWKTVADAYGVKGDAAKMNIHARTGAWNKTKYDPYVNMLRTATESFSAVVGGVDRLTTAPFDEPFGPPDEFSRRISRNTQIILNEEAHLSQVVDPAGGSYYIESLTAEFAEKTWELFQGVEKDGGLLKALQNGKPHEMIKEVTDCRSKDIAKRKSVLVGINMYANPTEEKKEDRVIDHAAVVKKRADYLQKFRVSGDSAKHNGILNQLQELSDNDTVARIDKGVEALVAGATLGEVARAARASAAAAVTVDPLPPFRAAAMFEEMRDASRDYKARTGSLPKVFLATMGPLKEFKGRADFSRGFFETGGFEVVYPNGFGSPADAAKAAAEAKADAVVICSIDEKYPELVPPLVKELRSAMSEVTIALAGYPKDQVEQHKANGVDEFIFLGADVHELLSKLLKKIGAM